MRADQEQSVQQSKTPGPTLPTEHKDALVVIKAAIRAMRLSQWSKNGFVLLALIFARRLSDSMALGRTLVAFVAFCFASSAVYIINDLADRERDHMHPRKRLRPIASGELSLRGAAITLALCLCVAAGLVALLTFTAPLNIADPFRRWGGSEF